MPLKIFRRKDTFYIRGTVAGRRIYRSTGTGERELAERIRIRAESEILAELRDGRKREASFAECALTYMQNGGEGRFLERILHHFGEKTLITEIDNKALMAAAQAIYPDAAPATINRQLITPVAAIYAMAAEDELCPPRKFRRRKVSSKVTRWLTPEEFERFAAHLPAHITPIIGFMIGTGARVRETLRAEATRFNHATGEAYLTDTKNGHPRMVQYPPRAARMITARPMPLEGVAFPNNHGRPYVVRDNSGGQIKRAFDTAREAAGLGRDVTPHIIRHTWATWYYSQTRDFGALLDLGAWSDPKTANIYRKVAPEDLAQRLLDHGWDYRRQAHSLPAQPPQLRIVSS